MILEEKLRKNQAGITVCEKVIEEKDNLIKELEIKLADGITGDNDTLQATNSLDPTEAYKEFTDNFTEDQICELRSINFNKCKDSTFVMMMIKATYNENLSVLKNKSITGRSRLNDKKNCPLTPEKLALFEKIYRKRLLYSDNRERGARSSKFKKHVSSAILNLSRNDNKGKIIKKIAEPQIHAIISNCENDMLVFKAIKMNMSVAELKVNFIIFV